MDPIKVACIQQRMKLADTPEDFRAEARRFLHQAQSKAAQLVVFPELTGLMLAVPLISGAKRGLIKHEARGKQPGAGLLSQGLGRIAGSTADAMGGGFRGSLSRMVRKNSDAFYEVYAETFSSLAREYEMAILAGSLYLYDPETATVRHRAYLFDLDGEVLGYSEKLNLGYAEQELASPGSELSALDTRFGRVGVLIGQDVMYPELARLLAIQGADLLIGIAASPGPAAGKMIRTALALRAEENQVYAAGSFLIGPNLLGQQNVEDYHGQAALLAPISLTIRGDGILIQTGADRTEGFIAAELDMDGLYELRRTGRFRPRRVMNLGSLAPVLAQMYEQELTVDQALGQRIASPPEALPEPKEPEAVPVDTVRLEPTLQPAGEEPPEVTETAPVEEKPEPAWAAEEAEEPTSTPEQEEEPPADSSHGVAQERFRDTSPEELQQSLAEEPEGSVPEQDPSAKTRPLQGRGSLPGTETSSVPEAMSITSFRKVEK
jgi:predicted amidohydrolase